MNIRPFNPRYRTKPFSFLDAEHSQRTGQLVFCSKEEAIVYYEPYETESKKDPWVKVRPILRNGGNRRVWVTLDFKDWDEVLIISRKKK